MGARTRRWSTTATSLGVVGCLTHIVSFLVVGWPWLSLSLSAYARPDEILATRSGICWVLWFVRLYHAGDDLASKRFPKPSRSYDWGGACRAQGRLLLSHSGHGSCGRCHLAVPVVRLGYGLAPMQVAATTFAQRPPAGALNKRLEPTRLAAPVYSCVTHRAAQAQRWAL